MVCENCEKQIKKLITPEVYKQAKEVEDRKDDRKLNANMLLKKKVFR